MRALGELFRALIRVVVTGLILCYHLLRVRFSQGGRKK